MAELIVKWSVKSPDDKILDPGCGSGTFLIEAYKRLAELKLKKPFSEIRYVPGHVHMQILSQLYGIDINEFPAHLTAMNIAMRNPKVPSTNISVIVEDFFNIIPGQRSLLPYKIRTPEGEKRVEIVFKDFDAIVGNPPYTRWTEIPELTQNRIIKIHKATIRRYDLLPDVARGIEPGIYTYWIIHATGFLKESGRLGMIISDSWLQTDYGLSFFKYLLENFKIHAVIDISARVFRVPLIGTCIILLEKCSNAKEREDNKVTFIYLDVQKGWFNADDVLKLIKEVDYGSTRKYEFASGAKALIRVYRQGDLLTYGDRLITLLFNINDILKELASHPLITMLKSHFEVSYGNILYLYLASRGDVRGVRNVGGEEFFYLSEEEAKRYQIPQEFLHPLIPSPRHLKFFTLTVDDWKGLRSEGKNCYLFLAHKPKDKLPENVRKYISLGEGERAVIRLRRRKGEAEGRPVSESEASRARTRYPQYFFGWYDPGGVVEAPIYVIRGTQYWVRFVLSKFSCALDDRILALVPSEGVSFDESELKALLASLNSSFGQLQAEVRGRSTGGGMLELDVKPLGEFLVLDVKRLPRDVVEKLAGLFDRLEAEARGLGGADEVENVFGSQLAKELTGREVRSGVKGLFNTVIKEIDYEIARLLGLEGLVEPIRTIIVELARRRLSRAQEEKIAFKKPEIEHFKARIGRKKGKGGSFTKRLNGWFMK
ncbi:MAG: N-6 DNA methylase [Thermoprotei archaeon]|nr:N-6 DNA methylase [Thermoprotei archaeon]